jgi:AhpC/TSA antioxidant enzyme
MVTKMMLILVASWLTFQANAFSATAPATSTKVYQGLSSTPLVRASDLKSIVLPSLWRSNTPLGMADEVAVCAFLRHYGWFLCWEHAAALKEQVLPAIPGQKLFFVGVGTGQAAAEFAEQLGIDPALCFGDEGGAAGDVLGLEKGFNTMWNPPAVKNMMARNDQASLTALGEAYKNAADNIGIQNLAPKQIKDTLRQGGTFVFKGSKPLLVHYDSKVGDNCEIGEILAALN